jgi:Fur family transcriptional regulator, ferric uptake regulator
MPNSGHFRGLATRRGGEMPSKKTTSKSAPSVQSCQGHVHDPTATLDLATQRLKASGLKLTRPRLILLKAMVGFHSPFSTEQLYRATELPKTSKSRKKGPQQASDSRAELDLVTVYRSLATFSELGLVSKVDLGDGVVRYELSDPDGSHHHHVICTKCQGIQPLDFIEIEREIVAQEKKLRDLGYSGLSHRLEFFGLCLDCSRTSAGGRKV